MLQSTSFHWCYSRHLFIDTTAGTNIWVLHFLYNSHAKSIKHYANIKLQRVNEVSHFESLLNIFLYGINTSSFLILYANNITSNKERLIYNVVLLVQNATIIVYLYNDKSKILTSQGPSIKYSPFLGKNSEQHAKCF